MKLIKEFGIAVSCVFFSIFINASNGLCDAIRNQSRVYAKAINKENIDGVLDLCNANAAILPEYHKTLTGKALIKSYYNEFFKNTKTLKYAKSPFEIKEIGSLFIELGTFEHTYETPNGNEFDYDGKYTTYWSISSDGAPRIIAHIWGASSYFEPENVNFINVETENLEELTPKSNLEIKIEEHRKYVFDAVSKGNAEKQLTTYSDDAVYMTYYDPPFIGKDEISKYFNSHYNPDSPMRKLITKAVKIVDLGVYALKFGEYYVEWMHEGKVHCIKGKGLTLYQNSTDKPLKIYRQMINHSIPATLKSEVDREKVEDILRHLDNQNLSLDQYLSVFSDEQLEVMPPNQKRIIGKRDFKDHLTKERQNGSISIKHGIHDLQSFDDVVVLSGKSEGQYRSKGTVASNSFRTKNFIVFKRKENEELEISKLIWNSAPVN